MAEEILLTVKEAADRLGVRDTAIRNAIYRDRLPSRQLYGVTLIALADLEAYRTTAKRGRPRKAPSVKESVAPARPRSRSDRQEGAIEGIPSQWKDLLPTPVPFMVRDDGRNWSEIEGFDP